MILFDGALGLLLFAVWLFCIIDVITTPPQACRNLHKLVWLAVVVLLLEIGAIAWLIAGRPWNRERPVARAAARRPLSPDDDPEFIETLRRRAEEQRRRSTGDETDAT